MYNAKKQTNTCPSVRGVPNLGCIRPHQTTAYPEASPEVGSSVPQSEAGAQRSVGWQLTSPPSPPAPKKQQRDKGSETEEDEVEALNEADLAPTPTQPYAAAFASPAKPLVRNE
eukprot:scaffold367338_cov48-Prasinocladus_malaysianus.AAC.1